MCQRVIIGFAEEQSAGEVSFCRPLCSFCASSPHTSHDKRTVACSHSVSRVLLSWQNGQSTAEDGVTPAVKVATHSPTHTHSYMHSKRDPKFIGASSRNKRYTGRFFSNR